MNRLTVNVQYLCTALRAAALFADDPEDGYPELAAIHLEAADGIFTATATERHVLGHARAHTGFGSIEQGGVGIRVRAARLIIDAFDMTIGDVTVETGPVGTPMKVNDGTTALEIPTTRVPGACKYRELFATNENAPRTADGQVLISPYLLRCFADLADIYPGEASRWTVADPQAAVRVEVGNDFVALLMPVNKADHRWPVPVGLPEPATALT